jgi:NitT/TauT family transport system substrate-binding protein
LLYTRDGEVESSVASGNSDVGVGVSTIGVLRAYAKGAPLRVIGANTTGTANYWYVQATSVIKAIKDITAKPSLIGRSNAASRYDVFDLIKQYRLKARPIAIGGPTATFNQVMSGHVDVGWAEAPFGVDAIEQGKIRVVREQRTFPPSVAIRSACSSPMRMPLQKRKDVLGPLHAGLPRDHRLDVFRSCRAQALRRVRRRIGRYCQGLRDEFYTKDMLAPDKVVGLDAIMKEAITSRYILTPLSKAQIAELISNSDAGAVVLPVFSGACRSPAISQPVANT